MQTSAVARVCPGLFAQALETCQAKLRELWRSRRKRRTLQVCETANLGERRFVAVIQFERQRFLIGGSSNSLTLLARLGDEKATGDDP